MSLTKITWEEFDTFEKIESPKGYDFRTHEGKYFNEYLLGRRTAREIDFKAENDRWPPTEEERRESRRKFISKHPASLIDVPKIGNFF